ncbi:MAG: hypothetical protein LBO07_00760 [Coriobacteriales bacterium]|nr:hypothetical protein [Coriobacteriales bacterium]
MTLLRSKTVLGRRLAAALRRVAPVLLAVILVAALALPATPPTAFGVSTQGNSTTPVSVTAPVADNPAAALSTLEIAGGGGHLLR